METGARARGLAGWTRERALGDGVCVRWVATAKVPGAYTRLTTHSGQVLDPPLRMPAKLMRCGARCAILTGSTAIRNLRIPLKQHGMFFSNRRKLHVCARFAHVSRTTNRQSHYTARAFLIATQLLEIELISSQQTRKLFLIASFSAVLGWRRKFANEEIGVASNARRAAGVTSSRRRGLCRVARGFGIRRRALAPK